VPLDHALLGLDVPSAPVQTSSLLVVLCHLKATPTPTEQLDNSNSKPTQPTAEDAKAVQNSTHKPKEKGKLRGKVNKVRNALKLRDVGKKRKSPQFRVCESLYQSGQIRKIYWCLLNKCCNARRLALEVTVTRCIFSTDCQNATLVRG
jgi:hypothetical protein